MFHIAAGQVRRGGILLSAIGQAYTRSVGRVDVDNRVTKSCLTTAANQGAQREQRGCHGTGGLRSWDKPTQGGVDEVQMQMLEKWKAQTMETTAVAKKEKEKKNPQLRL